MKFRPPILIPAILLVCAAAASGPVYGNAPEYQLAVDERLTTRTLRQISALGRCVDLWDFAGLVGRRGSRRESGDSVEVSLIPSKGSKALNFKSGDGACAASEGRLYVPVGFLSRQLGYTVEIDHSYQYVRVLTGANQTTKEDFIKKHGGPLEAKRLIQTIQDKKITRGILAVNNKTFDNVFTFATPNKTYVPLDEAAEALGGRVRANSASLPGENRWRQLVGDKGRVEILHDPKDLKSRRFVCGVTQPSLEHNGKLYLEAEFLKKVFQVEIQHRDLKDRNDRSFRITRFTNKKDAQPEYMFFSPGPAMERAMAGAEKENQQLFKVAYLTFDDGPSKDVTPRILDVLKQHGVKATFFVLGKEAKLHPLTLKRIRDEGHAVGNHTYTHIRKIIYASAENLMREIHQTGDVFNEILGERSKMFRAPYGTWGNLRTSHFESLHGEGFKTYNWNVDSGDSRGRDVRAETIVANVRKQVENKTEALILFHDSNTKKETLKALPEIIKLLIERDFEIKRMDYETVIRTPGVVK